MEKFETQNRESRLDTLKRCILSGDLNGTIEALKAVNKHLTESNTYFYPNESDIRNLLRIRNTSIVVSLGDGGTSRRIVSRNGDEINFEISERNSTEQVKENWKSI